MAAEYTKKAFRLLLGISLAALGCLLGIQANIGLAPWEAFSIGISYKTGLSYGDVVVLTGLVILLIDFALKEKLGFGTIFNTLMLGKFTDLIAMTGLVPQMQGLLPGVVMMLAGQVCLSVGSYFYIGAALGCGPRDALMVALCKRLHRLPIGVVRGIIEGGVLLAGWLLGAKVGLGTVISVFGIGFVLQFTFKLLRFEVKELRHESVSQTVARVSAFRRRAALSER